MGRYKGYNKFKNNADYYSFLRKKRKLRIVNHYETPMLVNPTVDQRASVLSDTHIWKLGDRLYKLADQYYGDPAFWWVIAWYNSVPTEAHLKTGDLLSIPINLNTALEVLGVDY
jgi:hypothetical protein|tara:strand:+ start:99 stop:440 length:342 start_codon:yes stop_codon:yes gene_type:complete